VKRGTSEREREGEGEREGERESRESRELLQLNLVPVEPVSYTKNSTTVQRMKPPGKAKILPGTLPSTSIQVQ
jgi:hypothetical protein|tara:strand:- start:1228 stop:1446 length:219 start_codon:yes stop_codon:yes gene_type:complete